MRSEDGNAAIDSALASVNAVPSSLGRGDGIGSNSWVVSGSRTTTGKPLLANDPHLALSIPGIWGQVNLQCRTLSAACPFQVSGFTFSGLPGVVIGHNDKVAWGMTNLGPDVTDFYLEQVSGDGYLRDGLTQAARDAPGGHQGRRWRRRAADRALDGARPDHVRHRPGHRRGG